jgi:hypothetical protein
MLMVLPGFIFTVLGTTFEASLLLALDTTYVTLLFLCVPWTLCLIQRKGIFHVKKSSHIKKYSMSSGTNNVYEHPVFQIAVDS